MSPLFSQALHWIPEFLVLIFIFDQDGELLSDQFHDVLPNLPDLPWMQFPRHVSNRPESVRCGRAAGEPLASLVNR
jgi:hypothetical protein